jgi:hypothetical protein
MSLISESQTRYFLSQSLKPGNQEEKNLHVRPDQGRRQDGWIEAYSTHLLLHKEKLKSKVCGCLLRSPRKMLKFYSTETETLQNSEN